MTNPNNAIGTNGAFGGRTSVNAFNDVMGALSRGVLSGWACVPNSGLTVSVGGNGTTRDVAIAEDNSGNKTSINNISNSPINVTVGAAPGTNSRIDSVVAYVSNPPEGTATETDNPSACGIIVVQGTAASTPSAPNDSAIRSAITADGAAGTTAYYVILANITMSSGTTDITANMITSGDLAQISSSNINMGTLGGNYSTVEQNTGYTWIDGSAIYKKTISIGSLANNGDKTVSHGISHFGKLIEQELVWYDTNDNGWFTKTRFETTGDSQIGVFAVNSSNVTVRSIGTDWSARTNSGYVTLYYTKTS